MQHIICFWFKLKQFLSLSLTVPMHPDKAFFQSTQTILKEYREQCNNLLNGNSGESSGGRKKDIALIITGRTMKFVFKPSTRSGINGLFRETSLDDIIPELIIR